MAINRGKQFEAKFAQDWNKSFPDGCLFRLHDQQNGYKVVSKNISDYIAFNEGKLYLLECKSHAGKSFPLQALTQFDLMSQYIGRPNVFPYVIIWMVDCDRVIAVPLSEIKRMKEDNKKSINIKDIQDSTYTIIEVPSGKKRVFMDSDYCILNCK